MKGAGVDPTAPFTDAGYLMAVMAVEALKKCGDGCNGIKMQQALESLGPIDMQGFVPGSIKLSATNHIACAQEYISVYKNGQMTNAGVESVSS
jgi:hypothetical protein